MFWLTTLVFAQVPAEVQSDPLDIWWSRVVTGWQAETGVLTYDLAVAITLNPDNTVRTVAIERSTATPTQNQALIERIGKAGALPSGTPQSFGLGAASQGNAPASVAVPTVETHSGPPETTPPAIPPAEPPPPNRDAEMFGGTSENRDAEMFGGTTTETPAPTGDRDADMLGSNADQTQSSLEDMLQSADSKLSLGGRLYLRLNATAADSEADFVDRTSVSAPNLIDLFADYRPDDHVRMFVNGRISYNYAIEDGSLDSFGNTQSPYDASLDELWLKWDVANRVFFTAGVQHLRFGTGRFWNPTDFLNDTPKDPLAQFDLREGVPLLKVHIPIEKINTNLYGVADFTHTFDGIDHIGGALRAEVAAGPGEYALMVAARKDAPLRLGADISMSVWAFDIKAEAALLHGDSLSMWSGDFDISTFTFPEEKKLDGWYPQIVAGLELPIAYSAEDSVTIGVEYFHNELGYENSDLLPWLLFNGGYKYLYLGQDYGALYVALLGPGNWDETSFIFSGLSNFTDKTGVLRLDVRTQVRTWIDLELYGQYYAGDQGEFHFGYTVPAGFVTEEELVLNPSLVTVGVGASINF